MSPCTAVLVCRLHDNPSPPSAAALLQLETLQSRSAARVSLCMRVGLSLLPYVHNNLTAVLLLGVLYSSAATAATTVSMHCARLLVYVCQIINAAGHVLSL
jgi:hypothetical protein